MIIIMVAAVWRTLKNLFMALKENIDSIDTHSYLSDAIFNGFILLFENEFNVNHERDTNRWPV